MNVVIAFVSFGTTPPMMTLCPQIVSRRPDRLFHFEPGTPRFSLIESALERRYRPNAFTLMPIFVGALQQKVRNCATMPSTPRCLCDRPDNPMRFPHYRHAPRSRNPGAAEELCRAFVLFASRH
jgi:hypothetical protein